MHSTIYQNRFGSAGTEKYLSLSSARIFGVGPARPASFKFIKYFQSETKYAGKGLSRDYYFPSYYLASCKKKVLNIYSNFQLMTSIAHSGQGYS